MVRTLKEYWRDYHHSTDSFTHEFNAQGSVPGCSHEYSFQDNYYTEPSPNEKPPRAQEYQHCKQTLIIFQAVVILICNTVHWTEITSQLQESPMRLNTSTTNLNLFLGRLLRLLNNLTNHWTIMSSCRPASYQICLSYRLPNISLISSTRSTPGQQNSLHNEDKEQRIQLVRYPFMWQKT